MTKLLDTDWKNQTCVFILSTRVTISEKNITTPTTSEKDFLKIFRAKLISKTNAKDKAQLVFLTQLDIEELETYNQAISGTHSPQWSQAIREELD